MGKNKGKTKHADPAGLSKKERKQLEARAVELEAKLAAKAAKKAGKKKAKAEPAAPLSKAERDALKPAGDDKLEAALHDGKGDRPAPAAGLSGLDTHTPAQVLEVADATLANPHATDEVKAQARKVRAKALEALSTDELRERVEGRKAARAALEAAADSVDRDDAEAVRQYNAALAELNGSHFLTSTAELERVVASIGPDAPLPGAKGKRKAKADELVVEIDGETLAEPEQVVTAVETETGTVYAAGAAESVEGTPVDVEFGKPSDAPPQLEEGRNGYKIMVLKADGTPDPKTVRQFTRVTTYISNLEDKTMLEQWKMRMLLEGIALDTLVESKDSAGMLALVADLMHTRDVALAKARKADRKGKLEIGELAQLEYNATKAFKDAVNKIADDALELGGVHAKADAGTNLHALAELYDAKGMQPINDMLKAGDISKTDHASIVAYGEALIEAGITVVESEVVVVNDELKRAGRLDRIIKVRLPGTQRAATIIADIKSGRLDFGQGKLAQQLEAYASSKGYDLATGERRELKLTNRKVGLVIHLPQGTGECHIYMVDLVLGAKGNKLSGEVRAWRNESKAAVDFTVDLAHPAPAVTDAAAE